ncbi:MAG: hypothetical protein ACRDRL_29855 [Sciscionella sp.]
MPYAIQRGVLAVDGRDITVGQGSAAMGHPADTLAWLATELTPRVETLADGDLVMNGGLTGELLLAQGAAIELAAAAFGALLHRVAESAPRESARVAAATDNNVLRR